MLDQAVALAEARQRILDRKLPVETPSYGYAPVEDPVAPSPAATPSTGYGTQVVPQGVATDSDTIHDASRDIDLRLSHSDAPELYKDKARTVANPAGSAAYAETAKWMQENPDAQATRTGTDHYGRAVGDYRNAKGDSLQAHLLRTGNADIKDFNSSGEVPYEYRKAHYDNLVARANEEEPTVWEQYVGQRINLLTPPEKPKDPKDRTALEELGAGWDRGWETVTSGLYGGVSMLGAMLARGEPGTASDPRKQREMKDGEVFDQNEHLDWRDRLSNYLQRTGDKGFMRSQDRQNALGKSDSFEDVTSGNANILKYVAGTLGEVLPTTLAALGVGVASALTGGSAAAVVGTGLAGTVGRQALLKAGVRQIQSAMAKSMMGKGAAGAMPQMVGRSAGGLLSDVMALPAGSAVRKNLLEEFAKRDVANVALKQGVKGAAKQAGVAGALGTTGMMEGGHSFEETLNETDVSTPWSSAAVGTVNGALETWAGLGLLSQMASRAAIREVGDVGFKNLLKRTIKGAGLGAMAGMPREGLTELMQELTAVANKEFHTDSPVPIGERMLSQQNLWRYAESLAAGALFGGMFGGAGSGFQAAIAPRKQAEVTTTPETAPGAGEIVPPAGTPAASTTPAPAGTDATEQIPNILTEGEEPVRTLPEDPNILTEEDGQAPNILTEEDGQTPNILTEEDGQTPNILTEEDGQTPDILTEEDGQTPNILTEEDGQTPNILTEEDGQTPNILTEDPDILTEGQGQSPAPIAQQTAAPSPAPAQQTAAPSPAPAQQTATPKPWDEDWHTVSDPYRGAGGIFASPDEVEESEKLFNALRIYATPDVVEKEDGTQVISLRAKDTRDVSSSESVPVERDIGYRDIQDAHRALEAVKATGGNIGTMADLVHFAASDRTPGSGFPTRGEAAQAADDRGLQQGQFVVAGRAVNADDNGKGFTLIDLRPYLNPTVPTQAKSAAEAEQVITFAQSAAQTKSDLIPNSTVIIPQDSTTSKAELFKQYLDATKGVGSVFIDIKGDDDFKEAVTAAIRVAEQGIHGIKAVAEAKPEFKRRKQEKVVVGGVELDDYLAQDLTPARIKQEVKEAVNKEKTIQSLVNAIIAASGNRVTGADARKYIFDSMGEVAPAPITQRDNAQKPASPEAAPTAPAKNPQFAHNPEFDALEDGAKLAAVDTLPQNLQDVFSQIIDAAKGFAPSVIFDQIKQYAIIADATAKGRWYHTLNVLAFHKDVLEALAVDFAKKKIKAMHLFFHEAGHALDFANTGEAQSIKSEQFAIDPGKLRVVNDKLIVTEGWAGPLMAEMYKIHLMAVNFAATEKGKENALVKDHFMDRYGFHKLKEAVKLNDASLIELAQKEVFAQAHALYFSNRGVFRTLAPQTTKLFESIYENKSSPVHTVGELNLRVQGALQPKRPGRSDPVPGQSGRSAGESAQGKPASPGTGSQQVDGGVEQENNSRRAELERQFAHLPEKKRAKTIEHVLGIEEEKRRLAEFIRKENEWRKQNDARWAEQKALEEQYKNYKSEDDPTTPFDSKRSGSGSGSGHTVQSFKDELTKVLGKTLTDKLLSRPNLHVLANTTDAPFTVAPDTAGLYLPDGSVYFFASNIGKGEAFGKVMHEVGAHYGLQRMLGKTAYDAILGELERMVGAEGHAAVKAAHARAKAAGATEANIWHETLGYLAEASPQHGLVRRAIAAIKRFLRSLGIPLGRLTDQDIVGMIQTAAFTDGKYEGLGSEQLNSTGVAATIRSWYTDATPEVARKVTGEIYEVWRHIAQSNDAHFKFGISDSKDMQTVADEMVGPGKVSITYEDEVDANGKASGYRIAYLKLERTGAIVEVHNVDGFNGERVMMYWPNTRVAGKDAGGAIALSEVALAWAANNNIQPEADPTLTSINAFSRYIVAMLSSALRYDSTAHLEPNPYGTEFLAYLEPATKKVDGETVDYLAPRIPREVEISKGMHKPAQLYNWQKGASHKATEYNVGMLAMREAELLMQTDPIFEEIGYDFDTGEFTYDGKNLDRGRLGQLVKSSRLKGYDNELGLGETTVMRGVVTQAALRRIAESGKVGRLGKSVSGRGNLENVLNSKRTDPSLTVSSYLEEFADGRTQKFWGLFVGEHLLDEFGTKAEATKAKKDPKYAKKIQEWANVDGNRAVKAEREAALQRRLGPPPPLPVINKLGEIVHPPGAKGETPPPSDKPVNPNAISDLRRAGQLQQGQDVTPVATEAQPLGGTKGKALRTKIAKAQRALPVEEAVDEVDALLEAVKGREHRIALRGLLQQFTRLIDSGLPDDRLVDAVELLYAKNQALADELRQLTAFVSAKDLPVYDHFARAVQLIEKYSTRERSIADGIEQQMPADVLVEELGGETETVTKDFALSRGKYLTLTLGNLLQPLMGRAKQTRQEAAVADMRVAEARQELTDLDQTLLDMIDSAGATEGQVTRVSLGSAQDWLDGKPPAGLAADLYQVMLDGKEARAANPTGEEDAEMRFGKALETFRAMHDAHQMGVGEMVLEYNAKTQDFRLVESITTLDPASVRLTLDPRTGEQTTLLEWLTRFIKHTSRAWVQYTDQHKGQRNTETAFWREQVVTFDRWNDEGQKVPGKPVALRASDLTKLGYKMAEAQRLAPPRDDFEAFQRGQTTLFADADYEYEMTEESRAVLDSKKIGRGETGETYGWWKQHYKDNAAAASAESEARKLIQMVNELFEAPAHSKAQDDQLKALREQQGEARKKHEEGLKDWLERKQPKLLYRLNHKREVVRLAKEIRRLEMENRKWVADRIKALALSQGIVERFDEGFGFIVNKWLAQFISKRSSTYKGDTTTYEDAVANIRTRVLEKIQKQAGKTVDASHEHDSRYNATPWWSLMFDTKDLATETEDELKNRLDKEYTAQFGIDLDTVGNATDAREAKERAKWERGEAGFQASQKRIGKNAGEANTALPTSGVVGHAGSEANGLIAKVLQKLGMRHTQIHFYNSDDLAMLENELVESSRFGGDAFLHNFRNKAKQPKAFVAFTGNKILLYADSSLKGAELAWAIAHEMGHVVYRSMLQGELEQNSVLWRRILAEYQADDRSESFMEWFADSVAEWSHQDRAPTNMLEAFYQKVKNALGSLLEAIGVAPAKADLRKSAVAAYLDALALRENDMAADALVDLMKGNADYDLLTFQTARFSGATSRERLTFARHELDLLNEDGLGHRSVAGVRRWLQAHERVNKAVSKVTQAGKTTGGWINDAFTTINAWLREQGSPALTVLADMYDRAPRQAVAPLATDDDIRALAVPDKANGWPGITAYDTQRLLDKAAALRDKPEILGVTVHRMKTGAIPVIEVIPMYRESFMAAKQRLYDGVYGTADTGHWKLTHELGNEEAEQVGRELLLNQPVNETAVKMASWLKNFFESYVKPGLTWEETHVGTLADWGMARYYSPDKILQNREAFIKLLTTRNEATGYDGMDLNSATELTNRIINGSEAITLDGTQEDGRDFASTDRSPIALPPGSPSTKSRKLNIAVEEMLPFLEHDVKKVVSRYVQSMIKRVEWDKRFSDEHTLSKDRKYLKTGHYADVLREAALYEGQLDAERTGYVKLKLKGIEDAYLGRYGAFSTDERVRTGMGLMNAATMWLTMPLSLLSQPGDMAGPLIRMGGNMGLALKGIREAWKAIWNHDADLWKTAEMHGVIFRSFRDSSAASMYSTEWSSDTAVKMTDKLFKWNGMQWFTNFNKLASFAVSKHWLLALAEGKHPDSKRWLEDLDLKAEDINKWSETFEEYKHGGSDVAFKVMTARLRFVQESMFSPNPSQRPLFASHPYAALVWSLKQFAYSYFVQMLKPVWKEMVKNPRLMGKVNAVAPLLILFPLAMVGMALRDEVKKGLGRDEPPEEEKELLDQFGKIVSRTGLLGPLQLLIDADNAQGWGRSFTYALAGPVVSKTEEVFRSNSVADAVLRLTPGISVMPEERKFLVRAMGGE